MQQLVAVTVKGLHINTLSDHQASEVKLLLIHGHLHYAGPVIGDLSDICTLIKQGFRCAGVAALQGKEERRPVFLSHPVHIRPMLNQQEGILCAPVCRSPHQGGLAFTIGRIHYSTTLQQLRHHVGRTVGGTQGQR